jgi:acyl-CoA hydrolase
MTKSIAAADVPALLRPGMRVYAPGLSGESGLLVDALRAAPACCAGVRFVGVWLPGYNNVDYAGLHPTARATAFFVGPALRQSFATGRVDYLPISYFAVYGYLRDRAAVDLAFLQVSPPDADGRCSLGVANDFTPAVLGKAACKVAHLNPLMPRTVGAATVAVDDIDYLIEAPCPVLGGDDGVDPEFDAIGRHVATLVPDGATLEVGVGKVQGVLAALTGKRDLALHTGAFSDPVLRLVEAGALADRDGAITAGVAWGSEALYAFVADNPRVRFAPVGVTHAIGTLGGIERFVAINSVIEVDLLGQANAEMVRGRQVSSAGGITDFMRGARLSPGGLAIVALPSTTKGGTVSRIVPHLDEGAAVSVARADMQVVVTEHGIADLRDMPVDARAEALIAVAAPAFRDPLAAAWRERRGNM